MWIASEGRPHKCLPPAPCRKQPLHPPPQQLPSHPWRQQRPCSRQPAPFPRLRPPCPWLLSAWSFPLRRFWPACPHPVPLSQRPERLGSSLTRRFRLPPWRRSSCRFPPRSGSFALWHGSGRFAKHPPACCFRRTPAWLLPAVPQSAPFSASARHRRLADADCGRAAPPCCSLAP